MEPGTQGGGRGLATAIVTVPLADQRPPGMLQIDDNENLPG